MNWKTDNSGLVLDEKEAASDQHCRTCQTAAAIKKIRMAGTLKGEGLMKSLMQEKKRECEL